MLEYCLFVSSIIVCLFSCDNNALEDWELHYYFYLLLLRYIPGWPWPSNGICTFFSRFFCANFEILLTLPFTINCTTAISIQYLHFPSHLFDIPKIANWLIVWFLFITNHFVQVTRDEIIVGNLWCFLDFFKTSMSLSLVCLCIHPLCTTMIWW